jgi:hypothetical protein
MSGEHKARHMYQIDEGLMTWARIEGIAPGDIRYRIREKECA